MKFERKLKRGKSKMKCVTLQFLFVSGLSSLQYDSDQIEQI